MSAERIVAGRGHAKQPRISRRALQRNLWGYFFVAPAILGLLLWTIGPMLVSLALSFTQWDMLSSPHWIGFANFTRMLGGGDPLFWQTLKVTLIYTALAVPLVGVVSSLGLALLLNRPRRAIGLIRTIFYLPNVVPLVANAVLWLYIYNPQWGLLNQIIGTVGIDPQQWIFDETQVIPSLVAMAMWTSSGAAMIVYLAGLQGIPQHLYEALAIDGGGTWAPLPLPDPAADDAADPLQRGADLHRGDPDLRPALHHDQWRSQQRQLVLHALRVSHRLPEPGDGLRLRPGLGPLRDRCLLQPAGVRELPLVGLLRGWGEVEMARLQVSPRGATPGRRALGRGGPWVLLRTAVFWVLLAALGASTLFPFVWLLRSSLMNQLEIFATPIQWLPSDWLWSNYQQAFTIVPFASYFRNTALLASLNIIGTVASSSFVAYGFARFAFWGRRALFAMVISTLMLPSVITLIPSFVLWHGIGGVNTYFPLFVPSFFGNAFYVFMLRQFYLGLPRDYDEAAHIDGANYLSIYWNIILPLSRPALVTVALFTFLSVWNDFLTPLIYLSDTSMYTVALGLQVFQGQYTSQWNLVMAASSVAIVPVILAFFFGQKSFIQGATLTGLKG